VSSATTEIAAEPRARDDAYEASIASRPDPRQTLQVALQLQRQAEDEVARIGGQLDRAKELVARLDRQAEEQQATISANETAAVEQLLSTFADGSGALPEPSLPAVGTGRP
jgi:hypothetical protein